MRLRNVTGSEELIANSIYVCNQPETYRGRWYSFFKNENPIHIEIGMGKGKFITEMARRHPDINYIGIDKYSSVLCRAVQKLEQNDLRKSDLTTGIRLSRESDLIPDLRLSRESNRTNQDSDQKSGRKEIKNLVLICTDARDLERVFGQGEIDRIYLNFSDPWPKVRHAERRLTSQRFLALYKAILNDTGRLELKTDNKSLFLFGLSELEPADWKKEAVTYDLHRDPAMAPGNVTTEYEEKFSSMGNPIFKFVASKAYNQFRREKSGLFSDKNLMDKKDIMNNQESNVNYQKRSNYMELMIKEDNFQTEVMESDVPVLVDFYADWCGPCKMMSPIIAGLAKEYSGRCKVAKCNIDDEMELAGRFHVLSIPTIIIFKNGEPENIIVGTVSKKDLVEKLEQALE